MAGLYRSLVKNTLLLYIRTVFSLCLQLIAVRFLLKYLGSEDYGLYGLVGSIVVVVESLKTILSGSIQRFINIELGRGNNDKVRDIFNAGRKIHIYLGIVLTLLTIVIGVVAIPFLKIPVHLQTQAYFVLIFTAANMGIGMIIVPYDAVIIAFEHFNAFALISVLNSFLKLGIVFLLLLIPIWRVSVYAGLLLIVTLITRLLNYWFCNLKLKEVVRISPVLDKQYYRKLLKFTGLQSLGVISGSVQGTGINFLLNIFGGLVVNTARTIAYQVLAAVNILVWNINIGFGPRCVTLWGAGHYDEFYKLMFLQSKICFVINAIMGCMIATFAVPILKIWLGDIPEYTVEFVQVIFIYAALKSFHDALDLPYKSSGIIKPFQIIITVFNLLSIIVAWILLRMDFPYIVAFLSMIICEFCIVVIASITAKYVVDFPLKRYSMQVFLRTILAVIFLFILFKYTYSRVNEEESVLELLIHISLFVIFETVCVLLIMFKFAELRNILHIIKIRK